MLCETYLALLAVEWLRGGPAGKDLACLSHVVLQHCQHLVGILEQHVHFCNGLIDAVGVPAHYL